VSTSIALLSRSTYRRIGGSYRLVEWSFLLSLTTGRCNTIGIAEMPAR
jgi:hypothetical protein